MPTSTITSKGQITIPKEIRDRLNLREGDRVLWKLEEDGRLSLRAEAGSGPLGRLPGLLSHLAPARPVTLEEMKEGVRQRMREKQARLLSR